MLLAPLTVALLSLPPAQVFTARQTAACERAASHLSSVRPQPLVGKAKKAWLADCSRWPDVRLACVASAPSAEAAAACASGTLATCAAAVDHAKAVGGLTLTAESCAELSGDVANCLVASKTSDDVAACDPREPCRQAVQVIAEVASADAGLSERERTKVVRLMTTARTSVPEIDACTRGPTSVRLCVESTEAVADLTECLTVEASWRPPSDDGGRDPFTAAFSAQCEVRNANRARLLQDVTGETDLDVSQCSSLAFDTIRCEAAATDLRQLAKCASARHSECERVVTHLFKVLREDPDVPEITREALNENEEIQRLSAVAECLGVTHETVQCLGGIQTLEDAATCYLGNVCESITRHLSEVIARDTAMLDRDRRAALQALRSDSLLTHCARAPASLKRCVARADTWAAAQACGAAATPPPRGGEVDR